MKKIYIFCNFLKTWKKLTSNILSVIHFVLYQKILVIFFHTLRTTHDFMMITQIILSSFLNSDLLRIALLIKKKLRIVLMILIPFRKVFLQIMNEI